MRDDAGGFSLLEVLVALAVLALAMSALVRTAALHGQALQDARERTYARWVASNVIAEARLSGALPEGTSTGDADMGRMHWHWRMTVVPTPLPGVLRLDVGVATAQGRTVLALSGFAGEGR